MKVFKLTATRPQSSAIVEGESRSKDGRSWTLFMDGTLIPEKCPAERISEVWNYKVNRGKRNNENQLIPFEIINVPEEGIDYYEGNDKLHALKMQNLISFLSNHYSIGIYEIDPITNEKKQINDSLVTSALMFILEDVSKKENEEFFFQKTKNKARSILDQIFDICHVNKDKTQLVNLAYGVDVEEPFKKNEIQLYNSITYKLNNDVKHFLEFVSNTDQEYHLAVTKGLIGTSDIEKPCITQDSEKRMFLGDTYLGQSKEEAVAYIKNNAAVYDYLKTKIHENSNKKSIDEDELKNIAKEAIENLSDGLKKSTEIKKEISTTASINELKKQDNDIIRECNVWIKKFKKATGNLEMMAKVSEDFDNYFRLNVSEKYLDFLGKMKKTAQVAAVVIEILPITYEFAREKDMITA